MQLEEGSARAPTSRLTTPSRWALFDWGFRPFFLLAGLYAVASIAGWLFLYTTGASPFSVIPPSLWHAHEMIFGFVAAALGGFLLTAVPNWTGSEGTAGWPLLLLVLAWLAGRVGLLLAGCLPHTAVFVLAASFVPALCLALYKPLIQSGRQPLLLLLVVYWLCDVVFVVAVLSQLPGVARLAVEAGIGTALILVTIIGGRILPVFTANALRARGLDVVTSTSPRLDRAVLVAMVAYVLVDVFLNLPGWTAAFATVAGVLQLLRFARWNGHRTWSEPIVWILHAAYAALPAGLLLRAVFDATGAAWAAHWLHVLTIGAIATMILAVMSRAALGHTGRPLKVAHTVAFGYVALLLATLSRALGPTVLPVAYSTTVLLAGGLWIFAFAAFTIVYTPILTRPRADGKPG